jgi:cbb3-type cytochrome oxidase maturation protein
MSAIVLLIAAGALVAGGFLAAFIWAVRSGQFDDTTTPAIRVLLDEPTISRETDSTHAPRMPRS